MKYKKETTERIIERAVGELYRGIYRLRIDNHHQTAYDTLGVILDLIVEERSNIRNTINQKEGK